MRIKILTLTVLAAITLQSCGDEHQFLPEVKVAPALPKLKFIHAASDTTGVNLFLDGVKITGNLPSTITTAGAANFGKVNIGTVTFQNAYPVTNYAGLENSSGTLTAVFPESYNATTTFPTKTMATLSGQSFNPESYYTIAFVGVTKSYELLAFEDDLSSAPLDGQIYFRFANFMDNAPNLSLRATPPPTTEDPNPVPVILAADIPYKSMSGFIGLPRTGTYTNVQVLNSASGAVVATLAAASTGFATNKVYTIFARGRIGGAGNLAPGVSRMINR